jgi:hypothetical protein
MAPPSQELEPPANPGRFKVTVELLQGDHFRATGKYESPPSALGGILTALGGQYGLHATPKPRIISVTYEGTIFGRGIDAHVSQEEDGKPRTTLLTESVERTHILMTLSDDSKRFDVMVLEASSSQRFYTIDALEP